MKFISVVLISMKLYSRNHSILVTILKYEYSYKWFNLKYFMMNGHIFLEHFIICYIKYSFVSCISHSSIINICKSFVVCWVSRQLPPSEVCPLFAVASFGFSYFWKGRTFASPFLKKIFYCWIVCYHNSSPVVEISLCLYEGCSKSNRTAALLLTFFNLRTQFYKRQVSEHVLYIQWKKSMKNVYK
jgi:hypothetical protein